MVRFQFLTPMSMKMAVFWDVSLGTLVEIDRRFRDDNGDSKHLWNVGQFSPEYTAQHPRKQSAHNFII
jgi:hypothetical protein